MTFLIVSNLFSINWLANHREATSKKTKIEKAGGESFFCGSGVVNLVNLVLSSSIISTFSHTVKVVVLILESGISFEILLLTSIRGKKTCCTFRKQNLFLIPPRPSDLLHLC